MPMDQMTNSPAAAAASMRRIISARTLCALAPMAARSRRITSLNKWPKNNHCGVRRMRTEDAGEETGPSSSSIPSKKPVAPRLALAPGYDAMRAAGTDSFTTTGRTPEK